MKRYFSLVREKDEATLNIYGDITSLPWMEGDVSAVNLSRQLEELKDVSVIHVHLSSYGGEVKEGLAIYNALRAHKAQVVTYCDSFACSIASVIFMAGDIRIMNEASLLMVHNAWTCASGNAAELRKQADDLEVITSASVEAYKARATISEKEIRKLMDNETWITPEKAVEYGFATAIGVEKTDKASQSARAKLFQLVMKAQEGTDTNVPTEDDPEKDDPEKDDPEKDNPEDEDSDEESKDNKEKSGHAASFLNAIFNFGGIKND